MESRILKNEQNYWNFLDQYKNDIKNISYELEVMKNVLSTQTKSSSAPVDELKKQLNEYIRFMESKIIYYDDILNKLQNKLVSFDFEGNLNKQNESGSETFFSKSNKISENELMKLINVVNELNSDNILLNKKITLLIGITTISFIAAGIALVLRFI
jgi:hypothetical protein